MIRHMQISYFAMPLSIGGLAVAFKISSDWASPIGAALGVTKRDLMAHEVAYQAIAATGFVVFFVMLALYALRLVLYPHKCTTDWHCPLRSNSFAMIPLCFMVLNKLKPNERTNDLAKKTTARQENI